MVETNVYFWVILAGLIGYGVVDGIADRLNLKALQKTLPEEFVGIYDQKAYERSQEYTKVKIQFGWIEKSFGFVIFLLFWWLGGFNYLDQFVRGFNFYPVFLGLIYTGILLIVQSILQLPFDWYETFVIEERFGFNKTTSKTFWMDKCKALFLGILIGVPLYIAIFSLLQYGGELAWLWGWLITAAVLLFFSYIAPIFFLPLFYKIHPLEEGELKQRIVALMEMVAFPLKEIVVIDGSKRSSKANAFFTGFGANKRIALFDTLVAKHSTEELVAVLGHEIGHYKKKHVVKHLLLSLINLAILFYLIPYFISSRGLFSAFGVEQISIYCGLIFFMLLYQLFTRPLHVLLNFMSRKHEFEADQFASKVTGNAQIMVEALKKLSKDSLSNLTPHPFYVFLHYSHPPVLERIHALNRI